MGGARQGGTNRWISGKTQWVWVGDPRVIFKNLETIMVDADLELIGLELPCAGARIIEIIMAIGIVGMDKW